MADTKNQDATITLHWLEKSRSQRILWMFEELNVPYELKTYKRGSDMLAGPELKQVHALGKSPVITVKPKDGESFVIAESGLIVEYISQYFGKHFIPTQYKEGKEDTIGGETEQWLRYRHFMHYAEGSLMTLMILALMVTQIKTAPVPFFIKPITRAVGSRIEGAYLNKNLKLHFDYLEQQLKTAPEGGEFFCGKELTGADVMLIFPLEAALEGDRAALISKENYPTLTAYINRIHERPAYKKSIQKIIDATGSYEKIV